jgi:Fe-S oxidoreductase
VFRESYYLNVEVLHHTQFIRRLILKGSIRLNFLRKTVTYHTPCELGRRSGIYDDPKLVLMHVARFQKTGFDDENSLCCGGSLANTRISHEQKYKIALDAAHELTKTNPDVLATACPLCKKTFAGVCEKPVADIAEIVAEALSLTVPLADSEEREMPKTRETVNII